MSRSLRCPISHPYSSHNLTLYNLYSWKNHKITYELMFSQFEWISPTSLRISLVLSFHFKVILRLHSIYKLLHVILFFADWNVVLLNLFSLSQTLNWDLKNKLNFSCDGNRNLLLLKYQFTAMREGTLRYFLLVRKWACGFRFISGVVNKYWECLIVSEWFKGVLK